MNHEKIAKKFSEAEKTQTQMQRITDDFPEMTMADAYKIQLQNVSSRKKKGEKVIGMKIGLTSKGMQESLGVDEPDYGHLFDSMLILEGDTCKTSELIQPRVEGEIAFCLNKPLKGPGITIADVYAATDYVVPAIEIVDSRVKDWKIKLNDTIADNGSAARLVVGSRMTPIHQVDMRLTGMTIEKNGVLKGSGTTAEVWGNPAAAVAWLANRLSDYDITMEAGSIVLSGAVTAALDACAGDFFNISFQGLGSVGIKFE